MLSHRPFASRARSLLEPIIRRDVDHAEALGLVIALAVLLRQWMAVRATKAAATGDQ